MKELTEHWNNIYINSNDSNLGWYETSFEQTLKFLGNITNWKRSKFLIAGAGTSGLIDILLKSDAEIILNDLSTEVIDRLKKKYIKYQRRINWLCHDLSNAIPEDIDEIDIWLDRAVLHFLVSDEHVHQYFKNVESVVKIGGYAFFAEYSKSGTTRCAGLNVRRYDVADLEKNLPSFQLILCEEYTYINPGGDSRPYIYALFKKIIPNTF